MQLVADILLGKQYHREAAAVHASNLSGRNDNKQYICTIPKWCISASTVGYLYPT